MAKGVFMGGCWRILTIAGMLLAAGAPLLALSDPSPEELEQNRRLLDKARQQPEHYDRLVQDLNAFLALPPERQEAIRLIDHDLHDENSATTARLSRVLERYARWLDRLPESDRQKIDNAPDSRTRLQSIKQIRERQWIERLPKTYREELALLQGEARAKRIDQLHKDEKNAARSGSGTSTNGSALAPRRMRPLPN